MADAKRDRQRAARQAKIEAELAARKRAARQRQAIIGGAIFAVLAAVVLIVNRGDDKKSGDTTATSTTLAAATTVPGVTPTTVAAGLESAAGKPCVARSQPLPEGAPEVDVEVGPPPTALISKDLTVGTGATVPVGATVTVNYIGVSCSNGVIFDSSYKNPPVPITFSLSGVIKGWTDGIPGMNVGGRRLLGIPADLAYGPPGRADAGIAPNEALWFVVEMVDFKPLA